MERKRSNLPPPSTRGMVRVCSVAAAWAPGRCPPPNCGPEANHPPLLWEPGPAPLVAVSARGKRARHIPVDMSVLPFGLRP